MAHKLSDLRAKQKALKAEADGLFAAAEKDGGELTAEQETRLAAIRSDLAALDTEMDAEVDALATGDETGAKAAEEETKRAADIVAACQIAGKADKAVAFITAGTSLSEVVKKLGAEKASDDKELHAHHPGGNHNTAADWSKVVSAINKRNGF